VYELITAVLNDDRHFYAYQSIEKLRQQLLSDTKEIEIEDFGAGSRVAKTKNRTISEIARSSLKPKKFGQLLFRIVDHYSPVSILELGTSLGITTAYLAAAKKGSAITTMEGAASVAELARQHFKILGLDNIELVEGDFDRTLSSTIARKATIDLAFIDGNHRYEPTIRYFNEILPATHPDSMLIFDDIHWSSEMEQAWKEIQQHPSVTLTIDLFFIGIVLFRKENMAKQHFTIRF
jgi:predicted O-methyltransferase YrrM